MILLLSQRKKKEKKKRWRQNEKMNLMSKTNAFPDHCPLQVLPRKDIKIYEIYLLSTYFIKELKNLLENTDSEQNIL